MQVYSREGIWSIWTFSTAHCNFNIKQGISFCICVCVCELGCAYQLWSRGSGVKVQWYMCGCQLLRSWGCRLSCGSCPPCFSCCPVFSWIVGPAYEFLGRSPASTSHFTAGMLDLQMHITTSGFSHGFWGLSSECQAWILTPLPAEPSPWMYSNLLT